MQEAVEQETVEVQTQGLHSQLQGLDSAEAVRRLMSRQQLEGRPRVYRSKVLQDKGIMDKGIIRSKVLQDKGIVRN